MEQRAVWVVCDACGYPAEWPPTTFSLSDVRSHARRIGWHYERAKGVFLALDMCPECCERLEWREEDLESFPDLVGGEGETQ